MIDLDEALAAQGAAWRGQLDAPPDLADAAARVAPGIRRRQRRIGVGLAASVAAIAALAIVGLVVVLRGSGRPGDVPAAVEIHGRSIPYAGLLSFSDVVADPSDPRVLHVYINKDDLDSGVCYSVREVGIVTDQTAGQVRVLVAGYAPPAGNECPGMGWEPSPVTVRLSAPLGSRTLIDGTDGKSHPVLDPATVPQPTVQPAPCRGRSWVTWNEDTGQATRREYHHGCELTIDVGRPGVIRRLEPTFYATTDSVDVSGHRALIVRSVTHHDQFTRLQWQVSPDRVIRVSIDLYDGEHSTVRQIVQLADSLH